MGGSDCAYWTAFDLSGYWGECCIHKCPSGDGRPKIMNRDEDCPQFSPREAAVKERSE